MNRWYVVHTQPNSEQRASVNLKRQGFETYLPLCLRNRRHARKVERVARPLFPNYMFVALDCEHDRWRSVNGTFGVIRLVTHGTTPLALPDGIVPSIQEREDTEGLVTLDPPVFQPGQSLEILEGPMASRCGLFQQMSDRDRVMVLLDLLGRQVRVTLPCSAVVAA